MARKAGSQPRTRRPGAPTSLSQFGLLDMKNISLDDDDEDEDEGGLEAELEALVSGKMPRKAPRKPKQVLDIDSLSRMAAKSVQDNPSDDDDDDAMDDGDLLAELHQLSSESDDVPKKVSSPTHPASPSSPVSSGDNKSQSLVHMLEERLKAYQSAENHAKSTGDTSKVRRYSRAAKTLESQVKAARTGQPVAEDDIPPPPPAAVPKAVPKEIHSDSTTPDAVSVPEMMSILHDEVPPPVAPRSTSRPAPLPPKQARQDIISEVPVPAPPVREPESPHNLLSAETTSTPTRDLLCTRRDQYKVVALRAKKSGDAAAAMQYIKVAKQFDAVIEALDSSQPVDLSNMPPPPPGFSDSKTGANIGSKPFTPIPPARSSESRALSGAPTEEVSNLARQAMAAANEPDGDSSLFGAPSAPTTVMEALTQRLEKFKSTMEAAQSEGNTSKVRRINRIVKQYEDAIKLHKAGKPLPDDLPAPPGFGPIPGMPSEPSAESMPAVPAPATVVPPKPHVPARAPSSGPGPSSGQAVQKPSAPKKPGLQRGQSTVLDRQLNYLLERQRMFKQAALEAKKRGDIQQAKEYLRQSKGLDPMIEATRSGLPIDATTIPTPPQLQDDFVVVEMSDVMQGDLGGDQNEVYQKLEDDLTKQIQMCLRNKELFFKVGDVSSASKFEKLGHEAHNDLRVIQHMWKRGDAPPKFHYETRVFSIVLCHTDLGDNEMEVCIIRGVNLPGKPNTLDSYVKIEIPFPSEEPQRAKTSTVKDTNNPQFDQAFKFEMNRRSRSLVRILKRHMIKLEVWSKGGFLRSDAHLGTASIKLSDLEQKCLLHDSYDLMEGRKACGGKVEARVRIRDPLCAKQVEEVKERWLVISPS